MSNTTINIALQGSFSTLGEGTPYGADLYHQLAYATDTQTLHRIKTDGTLSGNILDETNYTLAVSQEEDPTLTLTKGLYTDEISFVSLGGITVEGVNSGEIGFSVPTTWNINGANIYRNSNVGIGTFSPDRELHIEYNADSSASANKGIKLKNTAVATDSYSMIDFETESGPYLNNYQLVSNYAGGTNSEFIIRRLFNNGGLAGTSDIITIKNDTEVSFNGFCRLTNVDSAIDPNDVVIKSQLDSAVSAAGDNLGDHTMVQDLITGGNDIRESGSSTSTLLMEDDVLNVYDTFVSRAQLNRQRITFKNSGAQDLGFDVSTGSMRQQVSNLLYIDMPDSRPAVATSPSVWVVDSLGAGEWVERVERVVKQTDLTRSSTTMSDDPDLQITLPNSGLYKFEIAMVISTDNTADQFEYALQRTFALTSYAASPNNNTSINQQQGITYDFFFKNAGEKNVLILTGVLDNPTADNVIKIEWGTSDVNNVTLHKGSYIEIEKL